MTEPINIIFVDDEPGFAELSCQYVERCNENIDATPMTNVPDALDYLDSHEVDCVVSDYEITGFNGLKFLEAIRAEYPDMPFIVFTGRGSEEVAAETISAGASDYVEKRRSNDQFHILTSRIENEVEKQRARERAVEAEKMSKTVLDSAPDPILISVDGECVYANPEAIDVFGGEVSESPLLELVSPDDVATVEDITRDTSDEAAAIEKAFVSMETAEESEFPAEITSRPITWKGNDGIILIINNLRQTDDIEGTGRRYSTAFRKAKDGIVVIDEDGYLVDVNESGMRILDLPHGDIVGRPLLDFLPNDYDEAGDVWQQLQQGNEVTGKAPIEAADGSRRVVEFTASRDPNYDEYYFICRDITNHVEMEEQQDATQGALEQMYKISADKHMEFDQKIECLLELGKDYLDVPYGFMTRITDDEQEIVVSSSDHELLQQGSSCPISEAYCRKTVTRDRLVTVQNAVEEGWEDDPAYEVFELGCYIGAKITVNGDLYGTFCFAGTEGKDEAFTGSERSFVELLARWASYEKTQQQMTDEIRRQNEELTQFTSIVSHDLRSPLSVAQSYLGLVREENDSEELRSVSDAHERMERIIEDLLYVAKEGDKIGEVREVSLGDAVDNSWDTVQQANSEATLTTPDNLGAVRADYQRLCQLLENLFRNAIDHGGKDTNLMVELTDDGTGFAVEDDGPGIPETDREAVFEWGHTTDATGTGIGLHTVKEIVDAHDWTIQIVEGRAGGARFEITTE